MSASASKPKKSLTFNLFSEERAYYKGKEGENEEGEEGETYEPERINTKFIGTNSQTELPKEVIRLSSPHSSSKRYAFAQFLEKPLLVLKGDNTNRYLKLLKIKRQLQKEYSKAKINNNKDLKKLIKKDLENIDSSIQEIQYLNKSTAKGIRKTRKITHSNNKTRTQKKRNRTSGKSKKNNKINNSINNNKKLKKTRKN